MSMLVCLSHSPIIMICAKPPPAAAAIAFRKRTAADIHLNPVFDQGFIDALKAGASDSFDAFAPERVYATYSTVTDFARFRGLSTSVPRITAA